MLDRATESLNALQTLPLLQGLAPEALARLLSSASRLHRARGEVLFRTGQASDGLMVLLKGQVKVYARAPLGHEKVMEVVSAPACLGESLVCTGGAHVCHAGALTDVQLLLLPHAALRHEMAANPQLAMRLLGAVSSRLNGLVRDIEAVTLHTAPQRVVDYLLRSLSASEEAVQAQQAGRMVSLPASKGTIASLLSVTPEHFSRILHDLQARGLISVQRRQILIPDVQRLAGMA